MAKNPINRGREARESMPASPEVALSNEGADQASESDAQPELVQMCEGMPARPPWRVVALCIKSCSVYLGASLVKLYGGDWVTDAQHAQLVARDPEHFRLVPFESPAEMQAALRDHEAQIVRFKKTAAEIGLVVLSDGEFTLQKR